MLDSSELKWRMYRFRWRHCLVGRAGPSAGSDFGPERGKDADCVIGSAGRGEGARFVAAAKGKKRKLVVQIPKENNRF